MASSTGIPARNPALGEEEPLLGRPGDASQRTGEKIITNLWIGTAPLSQAGIWILTTVVWAGVFNTDLMLFSAHPLLNSVGLLLMTQAILVLQPTHTAVQKLNGTYVHAGLNSLAFAALLSGLVVIEVNKFGHGGTHFESPHALLGLVTYIFLLIQTLVGITQFWVPSIYGGVDNAKAVWKYHRMSGYIVLTLGLATVAAATQTSFNITTLKIELWAVLVSTVLVLVGVLPRVKLQKLGIKRQ